MTSPTHFQFLRIHAHQRDKVNDILLEATRAPSHCSHISKPAPAKWLMGNAQNVFAAVDEYMATPHIVRRNGGNVMRKPRADYRCFMDAVASYPVPMEFIKSGKDHVRQELKRWCSDVVVFMQNEFGADVVACCVHGDETYPHIHFFLVGSAAHVHPGYKQELENGRRIADNAERIRRHKRGLMDFQDRYHNEVGERNGHQRKGSRRPLQRIVSRQRFFGLKQAGELGPLNIDKEDAFAIDQRCAQGQ